MKKLNNVLSQSDKIAKAIDEKETLYFFGLTFKGTIHEFESLREFLLKYTNSELIYQVKSIEYLLIFKASKVPEEMRKK